MIKKSFFIGEESSAVDIEYMDVGQLPENPEQEGLIELSELTKYITWRKRKS